MRVIDALNGLQLRNILFAANFSPGGAAAASLPRGTDEALRYKAVRCGGTLTSMVAGWVIRRLATPSAVSARLAMGGIAYALLLVVEFGLVLWLRGLSIREYLATRDPLSGAAYYVMLLVAAVMPFFVARR
jgi:type IV secretory pathway TrbD component